MILQQKDFSAFFRYKLSVVRESKCYFTGYGMLGPHITSGVLGETKEKSGGDEKKRTRTCRNTLMKWFTARTCRNTLMKLFPLW
jgi:hypothetical protein